MFGEPIDISKFEGYFNTADSLYNIKQDPTIPIKDESFPDIENIFDEKGAYHSDYVSAIEGKGGEIKYTGSGSARSYYLDNELWKSSQGLGPEERMLLQEADMIVRSSYGKGSRYDESGSLIKPHVLAKEYLMNKPTDPFDAMDYDRDFKSKVKGYSDVKPSVEKSIIDDLNKGY